MNRGLGLTKIGPKGEKLRRPAGGYVSEKRPVSPGAPFAAALAGRVVSENA
jgi:hypothetical protein